MNSNWDEKRIRQLFVEMSLDDAHRAPDFDVLLQTGRSSTARSISFFALAAAISALVIVVATATVFVVRHASRQSQSDASVQPLELTPLPEEHSERAGALEAVRPVMPRSIKRRVKHIRVQRASEELAIAVKSFSVWQSPTAALLKVPGEELLKQLPRLGDSLQLLGSYSLDYLN